MKPVIHIIAVLFASNIIGQALPIQVERESILLGEKNILKIALPDSLTQANLIAFKSIPATKMSNKKAKDSIEVEVLAFELEGKELILFVTAWDSGLVVIPPFALNRSKNLMTEATMFRVEYPQVDENGEIMDIKETNFDIPLFQDFNDRFWWIIDLLSLLLFGIGLFLVFKVKDTVQKIIEPDIVIPADELAKQSLDILYNNKHFSADTQKLHFATFSDILRTYISARYDVVTFEKTTLELINALRLKSVPIEHRGIVEELLSVSDMVKFSKATTDEVEIIRLKEIALAFINQSTDWHQKRSVLEKGETKNA
jgi:hypothetical protein